MDRITATHTATTSAAPTLERRLSEVWTRTDRIFGLLAPHAWLAQPIALRHPFIFYAGHLPAFAWNHVGTASLGRAAFHPAFDELFSRGIDPDVDDPSRCHDHPDVPDRWPPLGEVLSYRDRVRDALLDACARGEAEAMPPDVIPMVVEHELMHQETLLYMLQRLPIADLTRPAWLPAPVIGASRAGVARGQVRIAAGIATLGARPGGGAFGWDNEFPAVELSVPGFRMDVTPVTNAQFRAFVADGGYRREALWDRDGWAWREAAGLEHPVAWDRPRGRDPRAGEWGYRTLVDVLPLDAVADWPVYASLAEARAFARWQGRRLPTEAEYHRAAHGAPDGPDRAYPWGAAAPAPRHGNFHFRQWAPTPVGSHPDGASAWGVHDLVGDGWEWTDTAFGPFPGFRPSRRYPGYSADFFDGKHAVLKGGSWATDAALLRRSFRNWFQAHYPYVFAKFRCVS